MFDALKLLGSVVEGRSTPSGADRLDSALRRTGGGGPLQQVLSQLGASGGRAGGGLGGLLGGLMGQGAGGQGAISGAAPGQGGVGGGIGGILGRLAGEARRAMDSSSPQQEIARNNPAAIGGLGALAGGLLGGGRGAVGGGLLAVLGSLAYAAMQGQPQAPGSSAGVPGGGQGIGPMGAGPVGAAPTGAVPVGAGPVGAAPGVLADAASVQRKAVLVLRSMIHAAKADGQIDAQEMDRILGRLDASEDREARDFVLDEMRGPADPDAIAREVTGPLEAAEVYAAALMAIEADTPAERDYLTRLAAALKLPPQAVARIHGTLGMPA